MKKKFIDIDIAKIKVFFQTTGTFISNMFRNKLDLTPEDCEVSAYLFSILSMCNRSICYCEFGLNKVGITSDTKASLRMSMAVSLLKLKKKNDAERYFEASSVLLRQQNRSETPTISNAVKNEARYRKVLVELILIQNAQA